MRSSPFAFAAICLLPLAACGGADPVANGANETVALPADANAAAKPKQPSPDGSPPDNAVAAAPAALGAPAAALPAFLLGRWGLTPADCTSTKGDAKGLLVIAADEIRFYESRAVPAGNVNTSSTSFSADFTFTGEGQSWKSFQTLQLQDKRLVRTTSGPMASYTYAKCS
ncbi:MAG: hypothetical protein ABIQ32_08975 [Sphingomicrobium sp.]